MKKVIITLGFAAAAILAANAQEIPAAEEQPQTTVQTQPAPQNETLDSDTQPMDDRAVNDTYDNEVTEPETQTVRDEIDQTPTEPMQDSAVDEYPLQEETDAYDQPSTTNPVDPSVTTPSTTTPSTTDPSTTIDEQSSVGAPIDETQEEVVEMQGEDPNAQSSMQDVPSEDADDQSYSNTQDQGEANTEEPMTQPTDQTVPGSATQPEQDQPQDDASAMNDSEKDVKTISESELPEEVSQAFQDSEYANASIEKVYMLEEDAVNKLLQNNAEQIYAGDQNPDKIYQLQVKGDEGQTILYYDENGDLMGSASI
jgi:hypothetical protein